MPGRDREDRRLRPNSNDENVSSWDVLRNIAVSFAEKSTKKTKLSLIHPEALSNHQDKGNFLDSVHFSNQSLSLCLFNRSYLANRALSITLVSFLSSKSYKLSTFLSPERLPQILPPGTYHLLSCIPKSPWILR